MTEKRLSHRIAMYLQTIGFGEIGKVQQLGEQLSNAPGNRRKMLFLNDCNSGCVKVLTNGFHVSEFIYIDVSHDKSSMQFEIADYVNQRILPDLRAFIPEVPCLRENNLES